MRTSRPLPQRTSWAVALLGVVVAAACQVSPDDPALGGPSTTVPRGDASRTALSIPPPAEIPQAGDPVDGDVASAADLVSGAGMAPPAAPEVDRLAMSGDLRQAWLLVDALHFHADADVLRQGLQSLTGQTPPAGAVPWVFYSDLLLSWDVPAPPGYLDDKRALFIAHDADWRPFFDREAALDWRALTWIGLDRDAIAPLDDPEVVGAASGGEWLPDDDVVFGVQIGGEARAYPRRVLEVHEVVNDTVGGRPIAVTYCAPCGAAAVYDRATDASGEPLRPDGTPIRLRATGLAERGVTLLFDQESESVFGQLDGRAAGGSRYDQGVALQAIDARVSPWGAWRATFQETTVISDDAGVGRVYVADPLGARAAEAEYPIGAVDDRLPVDAEVLGIVPADGEPLAFAVGPAIEALDQGDSVEWQGVRVVRDAGGLAAVVAADGGALTAVETRWFAWSAVRPGSQLWTG